MKRMTGLLAAATLALAPAVVLTTAAPALANGCGTTVVTDQNKAGWTIPGPNTTAGSTATFVGDNLELAVPDGGRATATYAIGVEGVPLAEQTAQSNYTVTPALTTQGSSYQLVLDLNRAASDPDFARGDFATLVYEEVYPDGTWWSTRPLTNTPNRGGHGSAFNGTLAEISAAYPNAVIQSFGLQQGSGLPAATTRVDRVAFGCNVFDFQQYVAPNVAPTADFTGTQSGLTASFTDQSTDTDGTIVTRAWDFGDGTTSAETNPTHTYVRAGTYTVTLTVTDDDGATASTTRVVTVQVTVNPDTVTDDELPNTGADVLGIGALALGALGVGGIALLAARKRRTQA